MSRARTCKKCVAFIEHKCVLGYRIVETNKNSFSLQKCPKPLSQRVFNELKNKKTISEDTRELQHADENIRLRSDITHAQNIRINLIKYLRNLYNEGTITNQYNYNIYNNTFTMLIDFIQGSPDDIKTVEEINYGMLKKFLKFLRTDRTQRQFLSIHREVINTAFKVDIRNRDLNDE